jgi:hypothetical protein
MFRRTLIVTLLSCYLMLLTGANAYGKTITNKLAHWGCWSHTSEGNGYEIDADPSVQLHGKPSAHFEALHPDQKPKEYFACIDQDFEGANYAGKRVEFSGFIKTTGVNGWIAPYMTVEVDDETVAFDNMEDRKISGTRDWKKFSIVLDVPKNATRISIGFFYTGGGNAWLNELAVTSVDQHLKTTASKYDPNMFGVMKKNDDPLAPTNMDFAMTLPDEDPRLIMNWGREDAGEYTLFIDRDTKFEDKPSACIQAKVTEPKKFAYINQDINPKNYLGKRVRYSGFVKTTDVKDWTALWMRVDGANGTVLALDNMEDRPIRGTTDWKQYSVVLDIPENCKKIRIGLMQNGAGTSWMTKCALAPVTSNVPTTVKSANLTWIPREKLRQKPDLEFQNK